MTFSTAEVAANHQSFQERLSFYREYGLDMMVLREEILAAAGPLAGDILELGTGKGYMALLMARAGYWFTTLDNNAGEQRYAMMNLAYEKLEERVTFRIGDAAALPFAPALFNTIISFAALHHLEEPERVFQEMVRVLRPHGRIILTDFDERGFALVARLHALEKRTHPCLPRAEQILAPFFKSRGFSVARRSIPFQVLYFIADN